MALPREINEIQKEYSVTSGQYANAQYQATLYGEESARLFKLMRDLNNEAAERSKLDAQKKQDEVNEAANAG
jgi:hypothetical protein